LNAKVPFPVFGLLLGKKDFPASGKLQAMGGSRMADLVGKSLGKYQILESLGKGGMAQVYKAFHPSLDRFVAIKVLHANLASGADFQERFRREARAVAALRHQNIVQVFDFDEEDGVFFMVMEYVESVSLKERL